MREEFEKWAEEAGYKLDLSNGSYKYMLTHQAWQFWQIRQPEIDALNETVADLVAKLNNLPNTPEFTLWWQQFLFDHGAWKFTSEQAARAAFNAKNPEIAALNMATETLGLINRQLREKNAALQSENERLREAADRAEGFLFAVSLMPQLGPKIQGVALKHHEALREAMKEAKLSPVMPTEIRKRVDEHLKNNPVVTEGPADFGEND